MAALLFPSSITLSVLYALPAISLVYLVSVVIYRRYFHPLAKIPGPFLPAVTTLYGLYYFERYYRKIDELHKTYGKELSIGKFTFMSQLTDLRPNRKNQSR